MRAYCATLPGRRIQQATRDILSQACVDVSRETPGTESAMVTGRDERDRLV